MRDECEKGRDLTLPNCRQLLSQDQVPTVRQHQRLWGPAVRAAELAAPLPTPQDYRHSYGSWLADTGVPPHEIKVLMGYSSLRAVERYIHASEARMDRARDALGARRAHGPGVTTAKDPILWWRGWGLTCCFFWQCTALPSPPMLEVEDRD